jgi:hypothetical protein
MTMNRLTRMHIQLLNGCDRIVGNILLLAGKHNRVFFALAILLTALWWTLHLRHNAGTLLVYTPGALATAIFMAVGIGWLAREHRAPCRARL